MDEYDTILTGEGPDLVVMLAELIDKLDVLQHQAYDVCRHLPMNANKILVRAQCRQAAVAVGTARDCLEEALDWITLDGNE